MSENLQLPIIEKVYQIYKQVVDITQIMPKNHCYSLGTSTEQTLLELLELLVSASLAPKSHKSAYLLKAQMKLSVLKLKVRLCLELKLANETKLFQISSNIEEVGRMLGGWVKSAS